MIKYSVLTYIFNDYENIHEILNKNPEIEYICVTDNPNLKSNTWEIKYVEKLNKLSAFDKCYYVRFNPFEFVNTDFVLRIDGSIKIKDDLLSIFTFFDLNNYDIMLMINPVHQCLIDDYIGWVNERNYSEKQMNKCIKTLKTIGFKDTYKGYYQTTICLEKNNKKTRDIELLTYALLKYLGNDNEIERLDQTIWSFIINKFYKNKLKVLPVEEDLITKSKYFQWYIHKTNIPIPNKLHKVIPYLFNKEIKPIKII